MAGVSGFEVVVARKHFSFLRQFLDTTIARELPIACKIFTSERTALPAAFGGGRLVIDIPSSSCRSGPCQGQSDGKAANICQWSV